MKKEIKTMLVMLVLFSLVATPVLGSIPEASSIDSKTVNISSEPKMTKIFCQVKGERIVKELPQETIDDIIELAKATETDFYTIYNKWESDEDVDIAFDNVQPFFTAIVESGLTDRSVDELNELFRYIRSRIGKPRKDPSLQYENKEGDAQPNLYIWNGIPTPFAANAVCGIYSIGAQALGFAIGTHTLLPTIGVDLFNTWVMAGTGGTVGALGFTAVAVTEFACDFGFIGLMLGVWPTGVIIPFLLQIGFTALFFGVSIA